MKRLCLLLLVLCLPLLCSFETYIPNGVSNYDTDGDGVIDPAASVVMLRWVMTDGAPAIDGTECIPTIKLGVANLSHIKCPDAPSLPHEISALAYTVSAGAVVHYCKVFVTQTDPLGGGFAADEQIVYELVEWDLTGAADWSDGPSLASTTKFCVVDNGDGCPGTAAGGGGALTCPGATNGNNCMDDDNTVATWTLNQTISVANGAIGIRVSSDSNDNGDIDTMGTITCLVSGVL